MFYPKKWKAEYGCIHCGSSYDTHFSTHIRKYILCELCSKLPPAGSYWCNESPVLFVCFSVVSHSGEVQVVYWHHLVLFQSFRYSGDALIHFVFSSIASTSVITATVSLLFCFILAGWMVSFISDRVLSAVTPELNYIFRPAARNLGFFNL